MVDPAWSAFAAGVTGAAHARRGQSREDAFLARSGDVSFVAVSDGHGSERCSRAAVGAELAVAAAAVAMAEVTELPLKPSFVDQVVGVWRDSCHAHLVENSVLPHEAKHLDSSDPSTGELLLYGATLLVGAANRSDVALFQLGDGDALLVGDDFVEPSGYDGTGDSSETHSLCLADAADHAAVQHWPATRARLLMLSTDGFGSAFASSDWHESVASDAISYIDRNGLDTLEATMRDWCHGPAEVGGDDVSIALLVRGQGA